MVERLVITGQTQPKLPRHAKLRFDKPRDMWIILAPERVFELDDVAHEVIKLCDGERTVAQLIEVLQEKYQAPPGAIESDVTAMLQDLADKGFIVQ